MIKVIGVGDNVVDRYLHTGIMYPGGNALNFSVYANKAGYESAYLGVFGSDREGKHVSSVLKELGVDISRCRYETGENGRSTIDLIDGDRQIFEDNHGGVSKDFPIVLNNDDLEYIKSFDVVHTSIYSYMENEVKKIRDVGVLVSFDFSDLWDQDYLEKVCPQTDISLLSCGELEIEETKNILRSIIKMGNKLAIGTLGKDGAIVYNGKKFYIKKPYNPGKIVDTLGAGDSFLTGFLISYLDGMKYYENVIKQNKNAELTNIDFMDYEDELISYSMARGNILATNTIKDNGAFGFGISIE